MPAVFRRPAPAVVLTAALGTLLAGCSTTEVAGTANPQAGPPDRAGG